MTTESRTIPRPVVGAVVSRASLVGLALAVALGVLGAATSGSAAAWGAVVGVLVTVVIFAFGTASVGVVAGIMPSFSLVAAMLTYVLQLLVLLVVLMALGRSGLLEETLARGWIAAGVIAATGVWVVSHVVLMMRLRIPVYDLPEGGAR